MAKLLFWLIVALMFSVASALAATDEDWAALIGFPP